MCDYARAVEVGREILSVSVTRTILHGRGFAGDWPLWPSLSCGSRTSSTWRCLASGGSRVAGFSLKKVRERRSTPFWRRTPSVKGT